MSEFVTLSLLIYSLLLFAVYPLVRARVDVPPSFVGVLLIVPWIASMWMVAYDAHDAAPPSPPTDFYLEPPIDALHDLIESAGNGTHMTLPKHIFNAVRTVRFDDADEAACIYYVLDPATTSWAGKAVYAVKGGIRVVCEDNYEAVVEDSMYQVNVGLTDAGALRAAEGEATWVFRTRSEQEPTGAYSYDLGRETIAYGKERTQFNVYTDDDFDVGGEYRTVKSEYLGYDTVVALVKYNNVTNLLNLDTLSYEPSQETYERPYGSPYFYRIVAEARSPPSKADRRRRLAFVPTFFGFEFLTRLPPVTNQDALVYVDAAIKVAEIVRDYDFEASIAQDLELEPHCPTGGRQFNSQNRPLGIYATETSLKNGEHCLCWVDLPLYYFGSVSGQFRAYELLFQSRATNRTDNAVGCTVRVRGSHVTSRSGSQTRVQTFRTSTSSIIRCAGGRHPTRHVRGNGLQEIRC